MKKAIISRYGAFGDVLHSAHLPELIKKHYDVEYLSYETNYQGMQILQGNPFIDKLIPIDPMQFTAYALEQHWNYSCSTKEVSKSNRFVHCRASNS